MYMVWVDVYMRDCAVVTPTILVEPGTRRTLIIHNAN